MLVALPVASQRLRQNLDTGWKSPTANGKVASSPAFTNPTDAYSSNDTRATACFGTVQYHSFEEFDFGIPSTAVILGIEVQMEYYTGTAGACSIYEAAIYSNSGGGLSSGKSYTLSSVPATDITDTLGGAADLWGNTWQPSDFDNSNFYVRLDQDTNNRCLWLDHIQ